MPLRLEKATRAMNASKRRAALTASEWRAILDAGIELSPEERTIVKLLADGKSQAAVGAQLGMHRSVVWRKAKTIAEKRKSVA
jgi:DNA-binding CsgD family transcriptional regulator